MQPVALKRSETYLHAYNNWKNSLRSKQFLKIFKEIYEASFFGNGDVRCDILRHQQYSMLVLHYGDDFFEEDFVFLMDHIQEVLIANDYYNYMSDSKLITLDGGTKQTVERHYLKPAFDAPRNESGQFDRKFGNVIVEVFYQAETPHLLKLTCNYYHNPTTLREKGIDKLMEEVLRIV